MIITISGKQGAGKTTLAKMLAKRLDYKFISIGDLRGQIAQEHGLTIDELNEVGKAESWVHKEADKKTIEIGKKETFFVIEGWLAFHFIPNSVKVFLEVDPDIGAKRIFANQRPDEKPCKTITELKDMLQERLKKTGEQFKKYYGIDFLKRENYDFIIDTSSLTPTQVLNKIMEKLECLGC